MHRRAWVLIAGLLLASACAHRPAAVSVTPQPADSVTVNIVSHVGSLVIFAQAAEHSYRMGIVEVGTPRQFVLRFGWLWGRSVEFMSGESAEYRSGYLNLNPGDVINWEITTRTSRATRLP